MQSLEIFVFFVWKRSVLDFLPFVGEFGNLVLVHLDFNWFKSQSFDKVQVGVSGKSSEDPEEWLFILIV